MDYETKESFRDLSGRKDRISGFPIHCVLCNITEPFRSFRYAVAHLYGQRHRRFGSDLLYIDSCSTITFKGEFLVG